MVQTQVIQLSDRVQVGGNVVYGNYFNGRCELDRALLDSLTNRARLFYFKNP